MNPKNCFLAADLSDELPPAGYYSSTIVAADLRISSSGNSMVRVVHALEDVPPQFERVTECFVLDGTNPRGVALARRRLVRLYRACGLTPNPGDPISPEDLVDITLDVKVKPDEWNGRPCLCVVDHHCSRNPLPLTFPEDSDVDHTDC